MIMGVMPPHVRDAEPAHQTGQGAVLVGTQHQMPMVGHQAIGEEIDGVTLQPMSQHLEKPGIIAFLMKQPHAAVRAFEDVVYCPRFDGSDAPGYGGKPRPEWGKEAI